MSSYGTHTAFCRTPLHPGPCKGYKKGTKAAPKKAAAPEPAAKPKAPAAPKKPKAAPAPAAEAAAPTVSPPAAAPKRVTSPTEIGKPSTNGDASTVYSASGMTKLWRTHLKTLNDDQKSAAKIYTGKAYKAINGVLRKPAGEELNGTERYALSLAEELQSAMAPSPVGLKVFRGMNTNALGLDSDAVTPEQIKALEGSVLVSDAFTSTSVNPEQEFEGNISVEIEVPEGTPSLWVEPFSDFEAEEELLLAAGAKMRVVGVEVVPPASPGAKPSYKLKMRVVP